MKREDVLTQQRHAREHGGLRLLQTSLLGRGGGAWYPWCAAGEQWGLRPMQTEHLGKAERWYGNVVVGCGSRRLKLLDVAGEV
jgi:hypothetical protein